MKTLMANFLEKKRGALIPYLFNNKQLVYILPSIIRFIEQPGLYVLLRDLRTGIVSVSNGQRSQKG